MAMNKYHDFKSAKEIYIMRVLYHIHYGRLRKRIKVEIENHMDDMYDELKDDFVYEIDIANKIVDEMGDPDELGLELKEANKRILRIARIFKIALVLLVISIPLLCQIFLYEPIMEIRQYYDAVDITTIEKQMSEKYNDGKPLRLFAEADHNGKVHRYYVPDEQPEGRFEYIHTESIIVLGNSYKDKFLYFGGASGPYRDEHKFNLDEKFLGDYLFVLTAPTKEKYIKIYYEPIYQDSGLKAYWSDYIEYPQNGTYEKPVTFIVDAPDGYRWKKYEEFDENKESLYNY